MSENTSKNLEGPRGALGPGGDSGIGAPARVAAGSDGAESRSRARRRPNVGPETVQ